MTRNDSGRWVWNYEATNNTGIIVGAASASYYFGEYLDSMGKSSVIFFDNINQPGGTYNSREKTLYDAGRAFKDFSHPFCPTTAQCFLWVLGKFTSGAGIADDAIEVLDTGYQFSLTIRNEQLGGTTEKIRQFIGCLCNRIEFTINRDTDLVVTPKFSYYGLEDQNDSSNVILTTAPLQPGNDSTTVNVSGRYTRFVVTYDPDGTPAILNFVDSVVGVMEQNDIRCTNQTTQTVNKHTFTPHEIVLMAVVENESVWDDFKDRAQADYEIDLYKDDETNYIKIKLTNCRTKVYSEEADREGGYFASFFTLQGEVITVDTNYTQEEGTAETVATHFKGAVP